MSNSFLDLKKSRKSLTDKLNEELNRTNSGGYQKYASGEDFWTLSVDKAGNGRALVRFLNAGPGEEVPFVKYWDHGFEGPGGWYIENNLMTIGLPDPCAEYNTLLWASGKAGQDLVSGTRNKAGSKRRIHFISNVLVLDDPAKPEFNGRVMLFNYGKQIYDVLNSAMHPKFASKEPFNPFCFWEGADLDLQATVEQTGKGSQRTYKTSLFQPNAPVADSDEGIEKVWKQVKPLQTFLDPKHFKSYDELKAKIARVWGGKLSELTAEDQLGDTPKVTAPRTQKSSPPRSQNKVPPVWAEVGDDEGVDVPQASEKQPSSGKGLDYFRDLVKD
jgi:hypothetical protein